VLLLQALLVFSLSAIEYSVKEAAVAYPRVLDLNPAKRHYVDYLFGRSHARGLIGPEDQEGWSAVATLRNTLVHNNGIADTTLDVALGSGASVKMHAGTMAETTVGNAAKTVAWIVSAYATWCDAFLQRR
jgi:hypothetical protein